MSEPLLVRYGYQHPTSLPFRMQVGNEVSDHQLLISPILKANQ